MDYTSNGTKVPPGGAHIRCPRRILQILFTTQLMPMLLLTKTKMAILQSQKIVYLLVEMFTPIMTKNNQYVNSPTTVIIQQKRKVGRPPKIAKSGVQTKKTVNLKMISASNVLKDSTNYDTQISQLRNEFEQNQKMMTTMMTELTKNMQSLISQVHQSNTVLLNDTIVQKHEIIQSVDYLRYDNQSINDSSSEQSYNHDIQSNCEYPTKQNLSSQLQPQSQYDNS
uniref:Reverse transcriptase domain-containing protein n=1 Tax=Strongyloides venezuelensis TaxID=75913 RepID=A0A0K0FX83_STRVS